MATPIDPDRKVAELLELHPMVLDTLISAGFTPLNFHGRFVHIRYFALQDEAGKYVGCLKVTQDLTPLRALEGERRLLQYE